MAANRHLGLKAMTAHIPALGAGTSADTGAGVIYNAFANGAATPNATTGLDPQAEYVTELSVLANAAHTGQGTNYTQIVITHADSTGTAKNKFTVSFSAAGNTMAARKAMNFAVASGGTVTGAGTATLTVTTGTVLPWLLAPGDSLTVDRISQGTGNASPGLSMTAMVGVKS